MYLIASSFHVVFLLDNDNDDNWVKRVESRCNDSICVQWIKSEWIVPADSLSLPVQVCVKPSSDLMQVCIEQQYSPGGIKLRLPPLINLPFMNFMSLYLFFFNILFTVTSLHGKHVRFHVIKQSLQWVVHLKLWNIWKPKKHANHNYENWVIFEMNSQSYDILSHLLSDLKRQIWQSKLSCHNFNFSIT